MASRDDLLGEFRGHADRFTKDASAADYEWANDALDSLMTCSGLLPEKDELPVDG